MSIFAERIIPTFYTQKKQYPTGIAFLWRKGWDTAAGGVLTALRPKRPAFWYPFRTFLLRTIIYRFLYAKTLSGFESHLFFMHKKSNTLRYCFFGGKDGIRTHGCFHITAFPMLRLQPLGHLSKAEIILSYTTLFVKSFLKPLNKY